MASDRQTKICQDSDAVKKRRCAFSSLLVFLFVFTACTHLPDQPVHKSEMGRISAATETDFPVCEPCTRKQAQGWAAASGQDGTSELKAANCYAYLVGQGKDKALRLADAVKGRKLAETATTMLPKSGLAHYLYAYLTGLEAENDPLRGLELVPVIEREALLAAKLNPGIDGAGPDRMLGELYLRAPGAPLSIGDLEKAAAHFRRATAIAPRHTDNRLGLVETLLEEGEYEEACTHLHGLLSGIRPARPSEASWHKTLELLKRLCSMRDTE
jgi:tetratricopeptide (TPR) repeat protein